ncbi:hypothetical protein [Mycolicibacterium sarraceniae]|uniref:hypothetical protein n=1 Tax=Mycolicibacterium sarraceniae TaxID=1534348 RepID=UPI001C65D227|nr:hypothetical protein [Mycolicibacterium sarraceniae]
MLWLPSFDGPDNDNRKINDINHKMIAAETMSNHWNGWNAPTIESTNTVSADVTRLGRCLERRGSAWLYHEPGWSRWRRRVP